MIQADMQGDVRRLARARHRHYTRPVAIERSSDGAGDLAGVVLVEAVGSSITPFVPLPFVDDYLLERLLRRIARKVLERRGRPIDHAPAIARGYVAEGTPPLHQRAFTTAARFVVRKVALVLDVKKSHDVFGEAIAYALALDVVLELRPLDLGDPLAVGEAIHRAKEGMGAAAIEVLARAGREAFSENGAPAPAAVTSSVRDRVSRALGRQVDEMRQRLEHVIPYELARAGAGSRADVEPVPGTR